MKKQFIVLTKTESAVLKDKVLQIGASSFKPVVEALRQLGIQWHTIEEVEVEN